MKKLLIAGLTLLSVNAFSQSYMVLNRGVVLTTDAQGFVYDYSQFVLPYKVNVAGGQFFSEEGKLVTIDEQGMMYRKDMKVKKVKGKGMNYFINDDSELVTIDAQGFVYKWEKEKAFKKDAIFGGNYLVVKTDPKKYVFDLYTISDKGAYTKITLPGFNASAVAVTGGNYFMAKNGVIYTVSKDGFVFSKEKMRTGEIMRAGGNFFMDTMNKIYTVTAEGVLMMPTVPKDFNITSIRKLGSNYMIDVEGRVFTVDKAGNLNQRFIQEHDMTQVKILSN
jgi:hypothetical protein